MPYIVYQSLPHPWKEATEELAFQFGRWTLARWRFASVSNATSPLAPQRQALEIPPILQPTTYQQLHDDGTMSRTLCFEKNALRYVSYRGKRYFIDLSSGSFSSYVGKFSAKTRNTLKRKVRHFAEHSGGVIDLRCYLSPEEMTEFRQHAVAISRVTYQSRIGFGFPETEEFKTSLLDEAQNRRVCGFVLMHDTRPAAFVFCRVNSDIITYTIPGYDPEFAQLSPGTVLLYAILEKLFAERRFRVFDFGGQEWGYKALFATASVDYIRVIWFPITPKNLILVLMHHILRQAWRSAAWVKTVVHSARALVAHHLSRRSTGTTRAPDMTEIIDAATRDKPAPGRARPKPGSAMTPAPAAIGGTDGMTFPIKQSENRSFRILHGQPAGTIEARWRACLLDSDFPAHYTAPEFFLEPIRRGEKPFAILSTVDGEVTGVLTGVNNGDHVQSGLSVRPQIAFSRRADRARAMANLIAGLVAEAGSARLVDLFVWADMETSVASSFRQKRYEGVVMLDLSRGPDALFRKFSENKRRNIKKAIKYGVSAEPATSREDISAYYEICVDWSRRKSLPIPEEEEFQHTFALTQNRLLLVARYEGKIIAGVVVRFFPHGVMEYAANSSLENALRLRPNDFLHWHAIKWGCAEGMSKYSLGGTHLFLRKFGGEVLPTTRHRLDLTILRRFVIGDWIADQAQRARPFIPDQLATVARSLRGLVDKPRAPGQRNQAHDVT